jgi:toxin CptA
MKPVAPLTIPLRPSRRLLLAQSMVHLVAVGAVLVSTIPSWLMALLLLLVGLSLARQRRLPTVAAIVLRGDGNIEIVGADGTANEAVVHPHTLVLSFLVVLLYRQQGRLRSLTLPGDSLAAEDFRQLRLWLRWQSAAARPV